MSSGSRHSIHAHGRCARDFLNHLIFRTGLIRRAFASFGVAECALSSAHRAGALIPGPPRLRDFAQFRGDKLSRVHATGANVDALYIAL